MKIQKETVGPEILAAFDLDNFDELHRMDADEWGQVLSGGSVAIYTATDNDGTIAAILVIKRPIVEIGVWYLYSVAVADGHRKAGIATKLFYEAIQAEIPFGFINSHCSIDNLPSIRFHKSLGFVPVQYVNDFYGDFKDAILWRRAR